MGFTIPPYIVIIHEIITTFSTQVLSKYPLSVPVARLPVGTGGNHLKMAESENNFVSNQVYQRHRWGF
jgi:hypothetical protein